MDPALEHIVAMSNKPFQAFPGQDHKAHIDAHLHFMSLNMVQNNPLVMAAIQKNILEHISFMAQEQVQLEFIEELKELQMLQQQIGPMMQQNPQMAQQHPAGQRIQQITNQIEARKAVLIAEMTKDYAEEENKITGGFGGDPLMKLKARELDLRAMDNERKKEYDDERIGLDTMKAMMNDQQHDEKLEQNEELAHLRAACVFSEAANG